MYLNADLETTDAEKGIWIVFNHTFGKKNAGIKGLKSVQKGMYESLWPQSINAIFLTHPLVD